MTHSPHQLTSEQREAFRKALEHTDEALEALKAANVPATARIEALKTNLNGAWYILRNIVRYGTLDN